MKKVWLVIPVFLLLAATWTVADSEILPSGGGAALRQDEQGAWLGVMIKATVKKIKKGDEVKEEKSAVIVVDVVEDSPAGKAGIKVGDQLVAFNNVTLGKPGDLTDALKKLKEGDKATVTVLRDGKQMSLDVLLGAAKQRKAVVEKSIRKPRIPGVPRVPAPPMAGLGHAFSMLSGGDSYGMKIETLDRQLGEYFGAPEGEGVLIKSVEKDSEAEKAGFKAGDVIVRAGKKTVEDAGDFRSVLGAFDEGEKIPVSILRKGKEMTIELTAKDDEDEDAERRIIMRKFGSGAVPRIFHFDSDGENMQENDGLDSDDFDIRMDVDTDGIEEGVRHLRIRLNGKELDLEELKEALQEHMDELNDHMEELRENIEVEVDDDTVNIRTKKI